MNNYNIYPTLLDAWNSYKEFDSVTEEDLLARINRESAPSEEAFRGEAFNNLIDKLAGFEFVESVIDNTGERCYLITSQRSGLRFLFPVWVCDRLASRYRCAAKQVLLKGDILTRYGNVHLYGYADGVFPYSIRDIKTTKQYKVGKYRNGWQAYVYTFCMKQMGGVVKEFAYDVTDFKNLYEEFYSADTLRMEDRLSEIEGFIEFIEARRDRIKSTKIFGIE